MKLIIRNFIPFNDWFYNGHITFPSDIFSEAYTRFITLQFIRVFNAHTEALYIEVIVAIVFDAFKISPRPHANLSSIFIGNTVPIYVRQCVYARHVTHEIDALLL